MNQEQAKQILFLHRPDAVGTAEPEVAEALALLKQDEELSRWYETHRATQEAIGTQFRKIAVPAALKEQIISERPWYTKRASARHVLLVAVAAVVLLSLGVWWFEHEPREDRSFAAYRTRMISTAQRSYEMFETNDVASMRGYLKQRAAPADFVLSGALDRATRIGCLNVTWQRHAVSMICFKTGRPLAPGQASDLWLFVIERNAVPDEPNAQTPQLTTVNGVATASWTQDGKTYVLAVEGSEELLKSYL